MNVPTDHINEFGAWMLGLAAIAPAFLATLWPVRAFRPMLVRLTPWTALPAFLAVFLTPTGTTLELGWLVIGTRVGLDASGQPFLFLTALLWGAAGFFARSYLQPGPARDRFCGFYLLAMTGNLGLVLALDVPGFYLFFALMSFASYGLVIHNRDADALRAGRVYIALVVLGEVLLFAAFVLIVASTGSTHLPVAPGLAVPPVAIGLVVLGFGIKAGLLLLHVWLPLAHPVAPTPASAVLSGAMIKAGVIGWLRFLPLGQTPQVEWGSVLLALGLSGAFYGAVVGITQRNPKTVLAYSSVSQMGLITLGVGAGLLAPEQWPMAQTAVLLYVLHHGIAKGSLFLGVGVADAASASQRRWIGVGLLIPALALAGAPLTSGTMAKIALKDSTDALPGAWSDWLGVLMPWAAAGTTLLMARFLALVWIRPAQKGQLTSGLWLPWTLLVGTVLVIPFVWPIPQQLRLELLSAGKLWGSAWPILLGASISLAVFYWGHRLGRVAPIPAGDLLVWFERAWMGLGKCLPSTVLTSALTAAGKSATTSLDRMVQQIGLNAITRRFEPGLRRWPVAGLMFLFLALALVLLLAAGPWLDRV